MSQILSSSFKFMDRSRRFRDFKRKIENLEEVIREGNPNSVRCMQNCSSDGVYRFYWRDRMKLRVVTKFNTSDEIISVSLIDASRNFFRIYSLSKLDKFTYDEVFRIQDDVKALRIVTLILEELNPGQSFMTA